MCHNFKVINHDSDVYLIHINRLLFFPNICQNSNKIGTDFSPTSGPNSGSSDWPNGDPHMAYTPRADHSGVNFFNGPYFTESTIYTLRSYTSRTVLTPPS